MIRSDGDRRSDKKPSEVLEWEVEIRRLLMGEKALQVFRLGGAFEYVTALLRRKRDKAVSSAALQEALRLLVIETRTEDWEFTSTAACFLDLIGAYRPAGGFAKIINLLRSTWPYGIRLRQDRTYPASQDLHLKALDVLRLYFPAPPADERLVPGFKAYITLLRDHLSSGLHRAYALSRLLELGDLAPASAEFRVAVSGTQATLEELLSFLVPPGLVYISPETIGQMYVECIRISQNLEKRFRAAILEAGGSIEDTEDGCRIGLPDGRVALARIPWNEGTLVAEHMELRHQRAAAIAEQYELIH